MKITRRNLGLGAAALALLGAATLGYRQISGGWHEPTLYDDLLDQITDRRPAAQLGAVAAKAMPDFNVSRLAERLRQPGFGLRRRAQGDAVAGRVTEVGGWVVPESVARYSALAAQFT